MLSILSLSGVVDNIHPASKSYRPPSWPPPRDWVCVETKNGEVVSLWGDPIWDLTPWLGKKKRLNFGDGPKINSNSPTLDKVNADYLRLLMTWKFWGPRSGGSVNSKISNFFDEFRKIVAVCSKNGISISDLSKFPKVIHQAALVVGPSKFKYVLHELDLLLDAREHLSFEILDKAGIRLFKSLQPDLIKEQTEYIPPRIWTYQVLRLKECVDDYLAHQTKIEALFKFCIDAYTHNYGESYEGRSCTKNPFHGSNKPGHKNGMQFHGPFKKVAEQFGVKDLIEKWIGKPILKERGIQAFSTYLTLTTNAGLSYVMNFTLMRKEECATIRSDCLIWYEDEKLGRIPIIRGESTKTEPDESALWIASPSVENAISALKSISFLRSSCLKNLEEDKKINPYLFGWTSEPWSSMFSKSKINSEQGTRPSIDALAHLLKRCPLLFDRKQLAITEDDLKIARTVCPTLNKTQYRVGIPWPIAWHQLRRTTAVNMFASGKISDSSIQLQMKHLSRTMSLYYGRGNSSLRFKEEIRIVLINAQYEEMSRQFAALQTNRYLSPYGEEHKAKYLNAIANEPVDLLSEKEVQRFEKAARQNRLDFRLTVLGACMKNGLCEHDSVERISECSGDKSKSACAHVLFDTERREANLNRLKGVIAQMVGINLDTPRYKALEQERLGLENYFAHIE